MTAEIEVGESGAAGCPVSQKNDLSERQAATLGNFVANGVCHLCSIMSQTDQEERMKPAGTGQRAEQTIHTKKENQISTTTRQKNSFPLGDIKGTELE